MLRWVPVRWVEIEAPVRVADREASDQKQPIEHDLEPAEPAQAELVRDVAPQNLEEGVDWIVVHDDCLTGFMRVMPDVREISGTGYDLTVHQPQRHFAPTTLVAGCNRAAVLFEGRRQEAVVGKLGLVLCPP